MLIIGLTGGIGSGKSTVAGIFAEYDVPIIDADLIARELVEPGQPALAQITNQFGMEILNADGSLNRQKLRKQVFADSAQRKQLEAILHPLIRQEMLARLESVSAAYVILVIPLLVENGRWEVIDRVLVVNIDPDLQLQRVMQRDNTPIQEAQAAINAQINPKDRLSAADDIIDNSDDIATLRKQVKALHMKYANAAIDNTNAVVNVTTAIPHSEPKPSRLVYEQPLNERIRTFLRLEHLFNRARHHLHNATEHDAHSFICALIDINNLTMRGDLKSEIIKELERQHAALKRHLHTEGVDQTKLEALLQTQINLLDKLHASQEQLGQHLKSEMLFNNIRQRLTIPGGTCDFDLPVYHHWLNLPHAEHLETLASWLRPFEPLSEAIASCLDTIRNSTDPKPQAADSGYYEQALDQNIEIHLIRVLLDKHLNCYPTISAGKHRLNIRFMEWLPGEARSPQTSADVAFSLMICGF